MPLYCISEKIGSEWIKKKASTNLGDFDDHDRVWFGQLLRTDGADYLRVGETMYDVVHDSVKAYKQIRETTLKELSSTKADKL